MKITVHCHRHDARNQRFTGDIEFEDIRVEFEVQNPHLADEGLLSLNPGKSSALSVRLTGEALASLSFPYINIVRWIGKYVRKAVKSTQMHTVGAITALNDAGGFAGFNEKGNPDSTLQFEEEDCEAALAIIRGWASRA